MGAIITDMATVVGEGQDEAHVYVCDWNPDMKRAHVYLIVGGGMSETITLDAEAVGLLIASLQDAMRMLRKDVTR